MNDHELDTLTRQSMRDLADLAPMPPDLPAAPTGSPVRARIGTAAVAFAVVLVVVGGLTIAVIARSSGQPPSADEPQAATTTAPVTTTSAAQDSTTTTTTTVVVAELPPAYQLATRFGSEPKFDTAPLGTEVPPTDGIDPGYITGVPELLFDLDPPVLGPGIEDEAGPYYVGTDPTGDAYYAYAAVDPAFELPMVCQFSAGEDGKPAWGCGDQLPGTIVTGGRRGGPMISGPYDRTLTLVPTVLDPDTAVIAIHIENAECGYSVRQWQRTYRSSAVFFFDQDDELPLVFNLTVTAYDSAGNELAVYIETQDLEGWGSLAFILDECGDPIPD